MKKKTTRLKLNKKQISVLQQKLVIGGQLERTNICPVETINVTMCYGAYRCRRWESQPY